ncbi:MAG: DUF1540 domain-containing protein [Lachnospiraceae bacterium]|nr:DUF1540 domain-containing protein [Lachnospiraceae bacterium]
MMTMTNLRCSVNTCAHYVDNLCSLNSVKIEGPRADEPDGTCCDSFREAKDSTSNCSCKDARLETSVGCSAENCKFNEDCKCHADSIDICGCGAKQTESTLCGSFRSE